MCGSSPKAPPPPDKIAEAPVAPRTDLGDAGAAARRRRAGIGGGQRQSILTSGQGTTTSGSTVQKTLLGA